LFESPKLTVVITDETFVVDVLYLVAIEVSVHPALKPGVVGVPVTLARYSFVAIISNY
jgi:hypothetical protein